MLYPKEIAVSICQFLYIAAITYYLDIFKKALTNNIQLEPTFQRNVTNESYPKVCCKTSSVKEVVEKEFLLKEKNACIVMLSSEYVLSVRTIITMGRLGTINLIH